MPYNILLVDDDRIFREELSELMEDFNVIGAGSGREALDILGRPHEIDLVLLDVKMPGSDGTEILPRIKEISPGLPVVMLTGYGSKEIAIKSLKGNADDFIEKPIDIDRTERLIMDLILGEGGPNKAFSDDTAGKIEHVKEFLERNYHKKISLSDAADLVCLSPKYLSRIFKEQTGSGFSEYRLRIKVDKAREILASSGKSISRIAFDLGYLNVESFIRVFKRYAGCTPAEYRRRIREGDEELDRPGPRV